MTRRAVVFAVIVGTILLPARPARAHQAGAVPSAAPAAASGLDEVKQVRAELERLRAEFEALRRQYDERLVILEQRLAQIGGGPMVMTPPPVPATPAPTPVPVVADPAPQTGVPVGSSKVFNPDISANGNFVGAAGKNPMEPTPGLQLSEVETSFQAIVDPYARADFFLSVGEGGLDVEEGYITFTGLPANMLLKVGKLRAQFGKVNTMHTHAMPTVDRPLVTTNLVGGEEGLSDSGLSLSHLVINPHVYLELTGELLGGSSAVFQRTKRSDLTYVGRVRTYRDITESMNLDVGTSFAYGSTTETSSLFEGGAAPEILPVDAHKRLIGIDATFRYRPLRRAIYRRLNLRTELVWGRQDTSTQPGAYAFGAYAMGEYQFAQRWYIGARADRSGRALNPSAIDTGGSVFVSYWPTEFSQIRGQFRRLNFSGGTRANEFLFQFNFSIGAHGAHAF